MNRLTVPNAAIKYILFQRTKYLRFINTFVYRTLQSKLPFSIYNQTVAIEARIAPSRIKESYVDDMREEYLSIRDFLPKTCSSILDIGCGIAGIDVFLSKHYKNTVTFYLLDKTKIEKPVYYHFRAKGAFYNSLNVAKTMLITNGIPESHIHLVEATDNNDIDIDDNVGLVISLLSWGYHYPVETYLDNVDAVLIEGGSVITDIRRSSNGVDVIRSVFRKVDVIYDGQKFQRVLASK